MVQVRRELYLYRQREDDSSSSSSGDDSEGHDDSSESEDEELSCSDSLDDSTDTSEEEDVVDDEPMMEDGTVNFATSKTREHIIKELRNEASDIHLITGKTKKERHTKIWKRYAPQFNEKKVVSSVGRLLLKFEKKEGIFGKNAKQKKEEEVVWRTPKCKSEAYMLLYKIRLHSHGSHEMSAEDIYNLHPIFQKYQLSDFKKYDKSMIKLTDKHREQIAQQVDAWQRHRMNCPQRTVSSRGKPIWHRHSARGVLVTDTKSGKAGKMKPKELWLSNEHYQDFSLDDFRRHIYQEKYRQLAGPYWQAKRNKIALKEHYKRVEKLYEEWHEAKHEKDMDHLVEEFQAI